MANSVGGGGSFISGSITVDANGTAQAVGSGIWYKIYIFAKKGNSGQVYIGGPDVASSTNSGIDAGESLYLDCLLYTSPSPRDRQKSRMPSSA